MKDRSAKEFFNGAYTNYMDVLGGMVAGRRLVYTNQLFDKDRLRCFRFPQVRLATLQNLLKLLVVRQGIPDETNLQRILRMCEQLLEESPEKRAYINYAMGDMSLAMIIHKETKGSLALRVFMAASAEVVVQMRERIRYEYSFNQLEKLEEPGHA